jgi:hypothetical protein
MEDELTGKKFIKRKDTAPTWDREGSQQADSEVTGSTGFNLSALGYCPILM